MRAQKIFAFFILIFLSWQAHATFCIDGTLSVSLPSSITYEEASGGMISDRWYEAGNATLLNCDVTTNGEYLINSYSVPSVSGVYSFGGVAYATIKSSQSNIAYIAQLSDTKDNWMPYKGGYLTTYKSSGKISSTFGIKARIRLIATARLEPGSYSLPATNLFTTRVSEGNGVQLTGNGYTKTTGTIITSKSPTCKLSIADSYTLPKVDLSQIPHANAIAGTIAIDLSAACGSATSAYNVKYSLVDMNSSVKGGNYVTLRSFDSTEKLESVGLQLTDGVTTVSMDTLYSFGIVPATGGFLSKAMQVSYVRRTMTKVSPGRVLGEVALQLSYE